MSGPAVRRIAPDERVVADPTRGQTREEAVSTDRMWSGVVRAPGGEVSAWHHHGDHLTAAYVLAGTKRLEYGAGGRQIVEGSPGDFLCIPPAAIHRESNRSEVETKTIAFRIGDGPTTVAVDGPDANDAEPVLRITPEERTEGDPTSGMVREEALVREGIWAGYVRTASGSVSGWHHHGWNETTIYLVTGAMKIESGPAGAEVVVLGSGDFCYVPAGIVHRESNPSDEETHAVVVRAGSGPPTINVDGPEEA